MLIGYDRSPQICLFEYDEQRDIERHPERANYYIELYKRRDEAAQRIKRRKRRSREK